MRCERSLPSLPCLCRAVSVVCVQMVALAAAARPSPASDAATHAARIHHACSRCRVVVLWSCRAALLATSLAAGRRRMGGAARLLGRWPLQQHGGGNAAAYASAGAGAHWSRSRLLCSALGGACTLRCMAPRHPCLHPPGRTCPPTPCAVLCCGGAFACFHRPMPLQIPPFLPPLARHPSHATPRSLTLSPLSVCHSLSVPLPPSPPRRAPSPRS